MPRKTKKTSELADMAALISPAVIAAFIHWKKNGRYRVTLLQYAHTSQMHTDDVAKYGSAEAYNLMAAELCWQIQEARGDCEIIPYADNGYHRWLGQTAYYDSTANRSEWAARVAREQRNELRI